MRKRFTLKDESTKFTATLDTRALEPKPIVHIEETDLDVEGPYRIPFGGKCLAWLVVLLVTITSCVLVTNYGEYFSAVKVYVWMSVFLWSFVLGIVVLDTAKILLLAIVKSCLRKSVVLEKRIVTPSLVSNPENPEKKKKLLNLRKYRAKLYSPIPLYKLQNRLDDIKYHLEMKCVLADAFAYILIFLCSLYIFNGTISGNAYFSNNVAVETFANGRYTHSIDLGSVKTYDSFLEYMNKTLLPALFPSYENDTELSKNADYYPLLYLTVKATAVLLMSTEIDECLFLVFEVSDKRRRRRRRSRDSTDKRQTKPPPDKFRKMQLLNYFYETFDDNENDAQASVNDTGWTINHNSKLLGKARIRQVRVRSDPCTMYKYIKTRNTECAPALTLFNVETRNFSLHWKLMPSIGLTKNQRTPWEYQSAWETTTLPINTRNNLYPGGGYILELPKNIKDARIVLEFLDTFQWLDICTRAIFIEFTTYCVNTNFFEVATLFFERSPTGYFIPHHKIDTYAFLLELSLPLIFSLVMCCGLLFWLAIRALLRIHRTSFRVYIQRSATIMDLSVIVFGTIRVFLVILNHYYVTSKVQHLERYENKFIGFAYLGLWSFISDIVGAVFMCLLYFQLMRILSYKIPFYRIEIALVESYKRYWYLISQKVVLVSGFALFFHLMFAHRYEPFSTFIRSHEILLCQEIVCFNFFDHHMFTSPLFGAPIVFFLFMLLVSVFSVHAFLVVMCLYYHKLYEVALHERYHFLKFMAYSMTFWRHKDVMNFKERLLVREGAGTDDNPFATLRLRGGGHKMSKKCKANKENELDGKEFLKVYVTDFVTKNLCDTTQYLDVSEERLVALKYLLMYHLSKEPKAKIVFSEYALRALYCVLAATSVKGKTTFEGHPRYFFVVKKDGREIHNREVFLSMRKMIEDYGKEAGIIRDDYMDRDVTTLDERLALLDRKLCLLIRKSQ